MLQHNDEICVSVNAAKAEKNKVWYMKEISKYLLTFNFKHDTIKMGNQQPSSEQEKAQRPFKVETH